MEVMTPSLQSNLTSIKHIFFCLFVFKTVAKGRGPQCFLVLLFPCVSFPGAAERKIAHITVFSVEVGDYFWKHSQACRCKHGWGRVGCCSYSIFILCLPTRNFLFPPDAAHGLSTIASFLTEKLHFCLFKPSQRSFSMSPNLKH